MPRIVYAGDREIAAQVLGFIMGQGIKPLVLIVPDETKSSHAHELVLSCNHLDDSQILRGDQFRTENGINLLRQLRPDYIICIHFPYIVPKEVLEIPKHGVINLHPAYLPYNRGWHTPSWAIWDETPYGATLHFMDEGVDTGDIVHQKQIDVLADDTADTLYQRVKELELEVFKEAFPSIISGSYTRKPQSLKEGTTHRRADIASIQCVYPNTLIKAGDLIRLLRALTTSDIKESASFEANGNLYWMQIRMTSVR